MKFSIIGNDGRAATVTSTPDGISVTGSSELEQLVHSFIEPGTAVDYDPSQGGGFMGYNPKIARQVRLGLASMVRRGMIRSASGPSGLSEDDSVSYIGGIDSRDENVRNSVNDPAVNRVFGG